MQVGNRNSNGLAGLSNNALQVWQKNKQNHSNYQGQPVVSWKKVFVSHPEN